MQPSDQHIVESLLAKDEKVTQEFFYVWCRPLIYSLIRKVFDYQVDYDELVNELYLYLLADDGRRLRTFQGRSSIYQWLKCVATRFFLEKRDNGFVIEDASSEPLYPSDEPSFEPEGREEVRQDVERFLSMIGNSRYRLVLRRLLLEGYEYKELAAELNTSVANLYNIKKRAQMSPMGRQESAANFKLSRPEQSRRIGSINMTKTARYALIARTTGIINR
ncbi:MAG: sigma-70 family RNA polymerase sigma factor [Prevotella sp.]|nr:sigma-70 family RNA polymerase sigma factor [Prevotella sp.]